MQSTDVAAVRLLQADVVLTRPWHVHTRASTPNLALQDTSSLPGVITNNKCAALLRCPWIGSCDHQHKRRLPLIHQWQSINISEQLSRLSGPTAVHDQYIITGYSGSSSFKMHATGQRSTCRAQCTCSVDVLQSVRILERDAKP